MRPGPRLRRPSAWRLRRGAWRAPAGLAPDLLVAGSQHTLRGHASRVPKGAGEGAPPPFDPPEVCAPVIARGRGPRPRPPLVGAACWPSTGPLPYTARVSLSALIRRAMTRTRTWTAAAAEVERIGNNLNQIARWDNTHKTVAEAVEVIAHLVTVERALAALASVGLPDREWLRCPLHIPFSVRESVRPQWTFAEPWRSVAGVPDDPRGPSVALVRVPIPGRPCPTDSARHALQSAACTSACSSSARVPFSCLVAAGRLPHPFRYPAADGFEMRCTTLVTPSVKPRRSRKKQLTRRDEPGGFRQSRGRVDGAVARSRNCPVGGTSLHRFR